MEKGPLIDSFCVPVRKNSHPLSAPEISELLPQIPDWTIDEQAGISRLKRVFKHKNFEEALTFTNQIGAIAEEETTVVVLPVELLDSWMSNYQTWKEFVMSSMRKRFDELLNTLDSIAFLKMDERLERFFLDRYRTSGEKIFVGSHQDIALSLNTSREVISRLLKQMEKKGMITLSRNRVDFSNLL